MLNRLHSHPPHPEKEPVNWVFENKLKILDNDYFSFAVTRHPFDKVQSAYTYFYKTLDNKGYLFGRDCESFEDFIKNVVMPGLDGDQRTNNHLVSQTFYLAPLGEMLVHRHVDLKKVNECEWMRELFHLEPDEKFPMVNESDKKAKEEFDEWTMELKELVTIRYMQDFYLLGYEPY